MKVEDEVLHVLNSNAPDFCALRSMINRINLGAEVPDELANEVEDFLHTDVVCTEMCSPDLLMAIDAEFYTAHKKELAAVGITKPVFFAHLKLPRVAKFEGISGAIYPIDISGIHTDFIEMDSTGYFNSAKNIPRDRIARYFFDNHPHKATEPYQKHLASAKELYVALGKRTPENRYEILQMSRMK